MGYSLINLRPRDVYGGCNAELVVMISIGQLVDTGLVKVAALALGLLPTHICSHTSCP